ncbi:hypothetical protein HanRHA438_Chr16g0768621 [Helianthus annuus]|nr:hypothetical protein HanRHA438_Chr16g0768621 [Helianthus annuus]
MKMVKCRSSKCQTIRWSFDQMVIRSDGNPFDVQIFESLKRTFKYGTKCNPIGLQSDRMAIRSDDNPIGRQSVPTNLIVLNLIILKVLKSLLKTV